MDLVAMSVLEAVAAVRIQHKKHNRSSNADTSRHGDSDRKLPSLCGRFIPSTCLWTVSFNCQRIRSDHSHVFQHLLADCRVRLKCRSWILGIHGPFGLVDALQTPFHVPSGRVILCSGLFESHPTLPRKPAYVIRHVRYALDV